ncbi:MAG: hypothetical protein ACREL5_07280 [Gemmatimonadales bacterium]
MEDIIPLMIIFGTGAVIAISYSPMGKALADRLRHGKLPPAPPETDPGVYDELDRLRTEVNEIQERLDFAERMLTKGQDTGVKEQQS